MKYWLIALTILALIEGFTLTGRLIVPLIATLVGLTAAGIGLSLLFQLLLAALGGTACLLILAILLSNKSSHEPTFLDTVQDTVNRP